MKFLKNRHKKIISKFRIEIKKSAVTAIIAAFGFLIALSWRDVLTEWVAKFSETSPFKNNFIIALIITGISIIGILVVTRWNEKEN